MSGGKRQFQCFTKSRCKNNKIWKKLSQRVNWKFKTSYGKALIGESEQRSAYVVRCAIWQYFYNLKNVKNTHGGVLISASAYNFAKNIIN